MRPLHCLRMKPLPYYINGHYSSPRRARQCCIRYAEEADAPSVVWRTGSRMSKIARAHKSPGPDDEQHRPPRC